MVGDWVLNIDGWMKNLNAKSGWAEKVSQVALMMLV